MKKIIILIAMLCCVSIAQARIISYKEKVKGNTCTIRINPEKGLIDNGRCIVKSIQFFDADDMWLGTYVYTLKPYYGYKDVDFENTISYLKDTKSIYVVFEIPDKKEKKIETVNEDSNNYLHYHFDMDGKPICDTGYYWAEDGERCIKD